MLGKIFERQGLHAVLLAMLLGGVWGLSKLEPFRVGELWGIHSTGWLWISVLVPVAHQGWVWLCWRSELHASLMTRVFGRAAFPLYAVVFAVLFASRPVAVFSLAIANRGTLPVPSSLLQPLAVILLLPNLYLLYSVARYFGFRRAFGIDHFDESYRTKSFVREGIFRYSRNAMYVFGFFIIWFPGLWWASVGALAAAAFHHLFIWVHYYATELPDMRRIYGSA